MHKWPNDCKPPALPLTSSNMTARKRLMMKKPQMIITSTKYTHDHDENVSVRAYLQCTHNAHTQCMAESGQSTRCSNLLGEAP